MIKTNVKQKVGGAIVGTIIPFAGSVAPTGWLFCTGTSISNVGGSGSLTDIKFLDLFNYLWSSTTYTVSSGRGASYLIDWQAGKSIVLPDLRCATTVCADQGAGRITGGVITAGNAGNVLGSNNVALALTNIPAHTHSYSMTSVSLPHGNHQISLNDNPSNYGAGTFDSLPTSSTNTASTSYPIGGLGTYTHTHNISLASQGSSNAHNNMQPFLVTNYIIRY